MKKIFYLKLGDSSIFRIRLLPNILLIFTLQTSVCNLYCQWQLQYVQGTSLLDVDFINGNTGWASGDGGVIVKTTNGGLNWIQQNTGVGKRLEGIDAVDSNTVYAVGWFQTILKSTNGGTNWQILRDGQVSASPSLFKCFFLNVNTGWMLRSGGWILRTTDGGATLDSSNINLGYPYDIFFKDALTGVLCGAAAVVMKTTNGGVNWTQVSLPLYSFEAPNLYRLSFVGDYGWTIGEGGSPNMGRLVYRTTNFGSSWDSIGRVPYPGAESNYSVFFPSLNTGYAGGTTGYIFKTTNGGFNWIQQNSPTVGFRSDFWLANDSLGWCTGGGGHIFKTTNGGTYVSVTPVSNIIPEKSILYQNYPNPFNSETIIRFRISKSGDYKLEVFDILGRSVDIIFQEDLRSGEYQINYSAVNLPSGIYFYTLYSSESKITNKMILSK